MEIRVAPERLASATATRLIAQLDAELQELYPNPRDRHVSLEEDEVAPGNGVFVVAHAGPIAVGCGAVRMIDADVGELKRMFVVPAHRGQGVATAVLRFLETEAETIGATRLVLETGVHSPEALGLYGRAGYEEIPKFGPYVDSELSVCMCKQLDAC